MHMKTKSTKLMVILYPSRKCKLDGESSDRCKALMVKVRILIDRMKGHTRAVAAPEHKNTTCNSRVINLTSLEIYQLDYQIYLWWKKFFIIIGMAHF